MNTTQNAVANHEYRSVPITALAESATNPRKKRKPYCPPWVQRWRRSFPWAWAASGAKMRRLRTVSADFAKVEEIANRTGKGSLIQAKCGMRASSSDSSEPLLLVHRSARERCCPMTSRLHVIPYVHKTVI